MGNVRVKSLIGTILLGVVVIGCEKAAPKGMAGVTGGADVYVVKIDGCEYIVGELYQRGLAITHKANCSNPIHKVKP